MTYIYNMTTTPQKDFFPNSVFWCYQKTSTTVLVGAIPEKFSNMKNVFFSPSDITFHQTERVPHKSEIMNYLHLPLVSKNFPSPKFYSLW